MSSSMARLSLYYLISAFEADMRKMIDQYLSTTGTSESLLPSDLHARVLKRARADGVGVAEAKLLSILVDYLDFGDLIQVARRHLSSFPEEFQLHLKSYQEKIDGLCSVRNRVMHSRPLEFDDLAKTLDLVEKVSSSTAIWSELAKSMSEVSNRPEILFGITIPLTPDHDRISHNLPIPDFDETGFIGRREILRQLTTAIRGVYPVITVVGEGGLGKTSLALKAAYELIDDPSCKFDAVIFASAKTAQLTPTEIRRIEGAVNTSLGLMTVAVEALSGGTENPIEDLVQLLQDFNVLLILDNLETVIDENVRRLAQSMPGGSKLLITSRIGLGAFEYPILLQGLSSNEATQLLRAFSKVSGVERLAQMSNERLERYCAKMRNNPLHIKWFVSAVKAGKRPEEILADERMFLKFCLSNVYEQLSEGARKVVRTLLSVGGANSTSELAYLSELDETDTIRAIQELLTTNMFVASSTPVGLSFQTRYELTQLSRSYLSRFYSVAKEEQDRLMRAKRQLVSVGEQLVGESKRNPLSPYIVHCRDRSDAVAAKHLADCLRAMRSGDFDSAYEAVAKAKTLSPEFYEVSRVEGWLNAHSGNISEAMDAYERAIELAPDAPHVRMFFGGFLLLTVQDTELALPQYKAAHELLPSHVEPATELARCHLYLKGYDEALALVLAVGDESVLTERMRRKVRDLKIQIFQRQAEDHVLALEPIDSLVALESLRSYCESIDYLDQKMKQRISSTLQTISMVGVANRDHDDLCARAASYTEWLHSVIAVGASPVDGIESEEAVFLRSADGGKFGFARLSNGSEVFIHQSQLRELLMASLLNGDRLALTVVRDELGRLRAENVRRI